MQAAKQFAMNVIRKTGSQDAMPRMFFVWLLLLPFGESLKEPSSVSIYSDSEYSECKKFLVEFMPTCDTNLSYGYIEENIGLALKARKQHDWASSVPWEIFLNDVLPYAILNEPRDSLRKSFHKIFTPWLLNTSTITEAALLLNKDLWKVWGIHFKANQTPEILSPSQVCVAPGCDSVLYIICMHAQYNSISLGTLKPHCTS